IDRLRRADSIFYRMAQVKEICGSTNSARSVEKEIAPFGKLGTSTIAALRRNYSESAEWFTTATRLLRLADTVNNAYTPLMDVLSDEEVATKSKKEIQSFVRQIPVWQEELNRIHDRAIVVYQARIEASIPGPNEYSELQESQHQI